MKNWVYIKIVKLQKRLLSVFAKECGSSELVISVFGDDSICREVVYGDVPGIVMSVVVGLEKIRTCLCNDCDGFVVKISN